MSTGAACGPGQFRTAYASALGDYLRDPTESSLRVAYELGREAVSRQLSVLDLTVIHQETVLSALAGISEVAEVQQYTRAAGDFFLESLSSFEMVQRGFREVRQAFLDERRQTEMSRQLSSFLADASLALDASDSLEEMLRLVAEQARELVGADCCVVTVAAEGHPRTAEAASHSKAGRQWTTFIRWLDLFAIYRLVRRSGGSIRIAGEQLTGLPLFRTADGDRPIQGWLAASLTALDGRELGAIQLFDRPGGNFTEDDEAAVIHLAQMASAAVERARLYQDRR
jgi:Phosphoserine phosphatase RsbU, N-terminal domain/GAF domain